MWQPQAEKMWLAGVQANKKAVAPLLRFLRTTELGGRERAREREIKWEQKNKQVGEELLD